MNWLRKHRYKIFIVTVGGFLIGTFMGFGNYLFTKSPYDAAIVVNGRDISQKRYKARLQQFLMERRRREEAPLNEEGTRQLEQAAAQDLVREEVFLHEAEKYGVEVTDNELAAYIQSAPFFQKDGQFDQRLYGHTVTQVLRMPIEEFEEERRRDLKIQKLQNLMASGVKIGDLEFQWRAQKRLAEASPSERKELLKDPEELRRHFRQEQASQTFQFWLNQVNKGLKVKMNLESPAGR
jgi:peptidyl-prolyl cis-trans isomerase D